jgi:hypothetical protein
VSHPTYHQQVIQLPFSTAKTAVRTSNRRFQQGLEASFDFFFLDFNVYF